MTMTLIHPYYSGSDDSIPEYWYGHQNWISLTEGATGTMIGGYRYDNFVDNAVFRIYAVNRDATRTVDNVFSRDISDSATEDPGDFLNINKIDDDRILYGYRWGSYDYWRVHNYWTDTTSSYLEVARIGDGSYRSHPTGDGTHCIVFYKDASTLEMDARIFTTSGTSAPTLGSATNISNHEVGTYSTCEMGNGRFALVWSRTSNSDIYCCLVSVSGTTITVEDTTVVISSAAPQFVDICRMSTTSGAIVWHGSGSPPDIDLWRFWTTGDSLDIATRQAAYVTGYTVNIERYSDGSCLLTYRTDVGQPVTIAELQDTGTALSTVTSDTHSSAQSQFGTVYMGDGDGFYTGLVDGGGFYEINHVTAYDTDPPAAPAEPAADSGVYAIAISNDAENDGSTGFITIWRDGTLYLQKWALDTMTLSFEIPLGTASLAEVEARTKIAYPFALSDDFAFVYGHMTDPAYLSGTLHLIKTESGGGSGTWSDASPSGWDSSHILAGFYVGDAPGAGNSGRPWYGVRCTTGTAPSFWYGIDALYEQSTLPLTAGTVIRHGAFHISRLGSAAVGATYGVGSTIYVADSPSWLAWNDWTYDHPSGSHAVLRFL